VPSESTNTWYLLQCKPQQSYRAQEHLQNQHYHCFLPEITRDQIKKGKRQLITEPLFPGYLFLQVNEQQSWSPIRSTRGVARIVAFNGRPEPVPDSIIAALQERIAQQPPEQNLQAGDPIRITQGPFANIEAIFSAYDGDERVVILLKLLQQQQKLVLPANSIKKETNAHAA
jgi:transcriptional antiterminator RfaH